MVKRVHGREGRWRTNIPVASPMPGVGDKRAWTANTSKRHWLKLSMIHGQHWAHPRLTCCHHINAPLAPRNAIKYSLGVTEIFLMQICLNVNSYKGFQNIMPFTFPYLSLLARVHITLHKSEYCDLSNSNHMTPYTALSVSAENVWTNQKSDFLLKWSKNIIKITVSILVLWLWDLILYFHQFIQLDGTCL